MITPKELEREITIHEATRTLIRIYVETNTGAMLRGTAPTLAQTVG